ncbi:MAG: thioredoxin-disulfide reductase [Actinomycetota bacterium]
MAIPVRETIIVGSGPAGLTAAIYAARAHLAPLVIEGVEAGGQLMLTTDVENYPGFPKGIQGPQLMAEMRSQAERFGSEFSTRDVTRVDFSSRPFGVWTEDEEFRARTVIVSTGASARRIGLDSEARLLGRGVSYCATCDGFFYRDQEILVVGGGDSALEEAAFLTRFASKVTVLHRRDALRASKILQDRAFANPKISFIWDSVVEEILGEDRVGGVRLRNVRTGEISAISVTGVFVAIGHTPNTVLFEGQLELDPAGYIATQAPRAFTSVPGVFACGDVVDHIYRQAITAAGTGCAAALDAERFLQAEGALH